MKGFYETLKRSFMAVAFAEAGEFEMAREVLTKEATPTDTTDLKIPKTGGIPARHTAGIKNILK